MSKKKHDRDPLDHDDPGHPDFPWGGPPEPNAVVEGADVPAPRHEGTVNDLMAGWWKLVKDSTPDPATVGDHFVAYAASFGWALVDADTLPPPEE